jgi:Tfp pilus assembly protein PilO
MNATKGIKKILTTGLVLNIVVWGLYSVVFWQIRAQTQNVSVLSSEAENETKKDETLRIIKTSLSESGNDILLLDSYFVSQEEVDDFIGSMETLGKDMGVNLSVGSVAVEPDKGKDDFKEFLRLKVGINGPWANVIDFLSALENLPYKVRLDQVSVSLGSDAGQSSSAGTKGSPSRWQAEFEFVALKLK